MMKKSISILAVATALIFGGSGCGTSPAVITPEVSASSPSPSSSASVAIPESIAQLRADNVTAHEADVSWTESTATKITLTGASANIAGSGATWSGKTVTITQGGEYVLSGEFAGQIVVNSADANPVILILSGARITSDTGSAIAILQAESTSIVLADGTTNRLVDAATYADTAEDAPNAALFSADDVTIAGHGSLEVQANFNDGIAAKDGLVIEDGNITVSAVDDGIRGKDYLVIKGGNITITSGGDALKSDNDTDATKGVIDVFGGQLKLTTEADGFDAVTDVIISGGEVSVSALSTTTDASARGIQGDVNVAIGGGTVQLEASDDGVHSNGNVLLAGGTTTISSGDDGVHADGTLSIDAGELTISKSEEGLEASTIMISGGTTEVTSSDDGLNVSDGSGTAQQPGIPQQPGPGGGGAMGEAVIEGAVTVSGGTLILHADGDGFDSNGDAYITGGLVLVDQVGNGNGALDVNGNFEISGGELIAFGSAGMPVAPSTASPQGWIMVNASGSAGSSVQLKQGDAVIAELTSVREFGNLVYSSPQISSGQDYQVLLGSTSMTVTAGISNAMGGGMGGGRLPR